LKYYPVCLQIEARLCLVVGGGRVAERKVRGLLDCGAKIVVVSPELTTGLHKLYAEKMIAWQARGYCRDDIAGAMLAIAATDDPEVQDMVMADAERHNILLNVADVPDKCNFILPSLVKRGDLSIAISTSGNSPALAKKLRQVFEGQIGREYEVLNNIMGLLRPGIMARAQPQKDNELLFNQLLAEDMPSWIKDANWPRIQAHIKAVIGALPADLDGQLKELVLS
jgi:precorrin-2 dehydrogenase/sirohydrochlorin ferrochelatase